MILLGDNEGPDQPARMRRLIMAFAVRIWPKTRFRIAQPKYDRLLLFSTKQFLGNIRIRSYAMCEQWRP